jgi:ATP-dependent Zn protease
VTFVPDQQPRIGMPTAVRTILFWVLMLALAVVLWQMSAKNRTAGTSGSASAMSYSDFMAQVDKNNVSSVQILESPSTAEVRGQLRQPVASFRVTIPKESIPELTERLQKQGASIEVSTVNDNSWRASFVNLLPFVIILVLWIFMFVMRSGRNRPRQNPTSASPTSTIPTNRPLG